MVGLCISQTVTLTSEVVNVKMGVAYKGMKDIKKRTPPHIVLIES